MSWQEASFWKCHQCGMKVDGRISIGDHYEREHGYKYSSPRPASSNGDGGPKPGGPGPAGLPVAAAPLQMDPTPMSIPMNDPWVQIAAWVQTSRLPIVVKAIQEARA